MLDLTRVGGHYHADTIPSEISRQELLDHIDGRIWYEPEAVAVWVNGSELAASVGLLAVAPGSVIEVTLREQLPDRFVSPADVLLPGTDWGPFEQSPSPRRSMGAAVADERGVVRVRSSLLSPLTIDDNIRKALDLGPLDRLVYTEQHVYLDIHGDQCHTVYSGPSRRFPWLLDLRPLGENVRIFFGDKEPTVQDVLEVFPRASTIAARLRLQCAAAPEKRSIYMPIIVASCDADAVGASCHISDAVELAAACVAPVDGFRRECSQLASELKGPSDATSPLRQAVQSEAAAEYAGLLPEPFLRIGEIPPVNGPIPADMDDDEADEVGLRFVQATVLLFAYEHTHEEVHLRLPVPCTVEEVVLTLAGACDAERSALFPLHVPIDPQPSQWWLAFMALPQWAQEEPLILINLSHIDGRCFVSAAPNPFRRDQLLRLAQLPDDGTYEVFAFNAFNPMEAGEEVPLVTAGCVTVRRAGARRVVQGFGLSTMLISGSTWDDSPTLPAPPSDNRGLLVHGHGHGVVHPREDGVQPSAQEVADICGTSVDSVRVVETNVEIANASCHGFHCRKVFGVSFLEDNQLASGSQHSCVAFVDCRALLQGWSLELSESGRVSYSELVEWLDTFSPPDWQAQVSGAPVEDGFLLVRDGGVLTAEYAPIPSSEEDDCQTDGEDNESSHDGGDSEGGEDESSDTSSPPSGDLRPPAARATETERSGLRSRSRSPRRASLQIVCDTSLSKVCAAVGLSFLDFVSRKLWSVIDACSLCCMWAAAFLEDAVADGRLRPTSALWLALLPCTAATPLSRNSVPDPALVLDAVLPTLVSLIILLPQIARKAKLLEEPSGGRLQAQADIAFLRYVAPRLGAAWRYLPSPQAVSLMTIVHQRRKTLSPLTGFKRCTLSCSL